MKGLSCSPWAMLCTDSRFNKTLRGGSGYQVASDKKPHNGKGKRPARTHTHTHAHRHIKHIKHVSSYTTHTERSK